MLKSYYYVTSHQPQIASRLLLNWSRLNELNISNSNIGNNGVRLIAEALTVYRHLKSVDFSNNSAITDVGGRALLRCIYNTDSFEDIINSNHILSSCSFKGCQLAKKMKQRIGEHQMTATIILINSITHIPFYHRIFLRSQAAKRCIT